MKPLINPDTAAAMLNRGRTRMVQAVLNEAGLSNAQRMYDHWQGFASCAASLLSSTAQVMALHDQASDSQCVVQAALAGLPDDCERLSFADMKRLMRAQGVYLASDAVAHGDVDTVVQLQDGVRAAIKFDNEHSVASIDVQDGGERHESPLVSETDIVSEGGAA